MKTHNLQQGTKEWHDFRANHFTASEAPMMMGESPYKTRAQLLKEKATGVLPEVDSATQRRFDDGHRFEALARPLAEKVVGDELYPATGSDGKLSASFDGITMLEDVCFEHKTLNDTLRAVQSIDDLPMHYKIQMQQQLTVAGANRCLFMASVWDANDVLVEEPKYFWYESDPQLAKRIEQGWKQFEADLANYTPTEAAPEVVGHAPGDLPALMIQVAGSVTASNLSAFKDHALRVFANIKTDLDTDEDFADAEKTTKWCKKVEDKLESAKQNALAQTASIDDLFRAIDEIKEEARQKRLMLDKLVKQRKEAIKISKIQEAKAAFAGFIDTLQSGIKVPLQIAQPDFAGAIKGLRTIDSIQNALDTELANSKTTAVLVAEEVRGKLTWFESESAGFEMLFNDLPMIISKQMDDFQFLVTTRIDNHKRDEAARLEAERERIRQEEAAKIALAAAMAEAQAKAEEAAKQATTEAQSATEIEAEREPALDAVAKTEATLRLGTISERLGFNVTAGFLSALGFEPQSNGSAKLYHEDDFYSICRAIAKHVMQVASTVA